MEKIIYKEGCEGQNKLSCIEGIEIDLLNGQKALIYPKYAEKQVLTSEQISKWDAKNETEIEALRVTDTFSETSVLFSLSSPAAKWVRQFASFDYGHRNLPSLLAAMEIQYQKEEIDALAETIEGADLLRDFTSYVWSCSRIVTDRGWFAGGGSGYAYYGSLGIANLAVPTILYREEEI